MNIFFTVVQWTSLQVFIFNRPSSTISFWHDINSGKCCDYSLDERRRELPVSFDDDRLLHNMLSSTLFIGRRRRPTSLQKRVFFLQRRRQRRQVSDFSTKPFDVIARTFKVDFDCLQSTNGFLVNSSEFFQLRLSAGK